MSGNLHFFYSLCQETEKKTWEGFPFREEGKEKVSCAGRREGRKEKLLICRGFSADAFFTGMMMIMMMMDTHTHTHTYIFILTFLIMVYSQTQRSLAASATSAYPSRRRTCRGRSRRRCSCCTSGWPTTWRAAGARRSSRARAWRRPRCVRRATPMTSCRPTCAT